MKKKILLMVAIIVAVVVGSLCVRAISSKASNGDKTIVEVEGELICVVDGKVATDYTGEVTYEGVTYAVENGKVAVDFTGLFKTTTRENVLYIYVVNGVMDKEYTGLAECFYGTYVVRNGVVKYEPMMSNYHMEDVNGKLYYLCDSKVVEGYTGIIKHNGVRYYVLHGEHCEIYTGIFTWRNVTYCIEKGVINEKRTAIIDYALKQKDTRTNVADNTGTEFVRKVFSVNSIELPGSAKEILNNGVRVEQSNIKPGDIVIYRRTPNYIEMGIYVGNNRMVYTFPQNEVKIVNIKDHKDYNNYNAIVSYID